MLFSNLFTFHINRYSLIIILNTFIKIWLFSLCFESSKVYRNFNLLFIEYLRLSGLSIFFKKFIRHLTLIYKYIFFTNFLLYLIVIFNIFSGYLIFLIVLTYNIRGYFNLEFFYFRLELFFRVKYIEKRPILNIFCDI